MLSILLELLPGLVGAVAGGKVGAVIDAGTKVAKEVLGTEDPAAIKQALANPETAALFRARLEQETAQLQAELADVQDARHQTVALVQAGSRMAWAPVVISTLILTGFLGVTIALLFRQVPDSQIAMVLFGQLAGMTGAVVQYWLGSSKGSRDKDAVIASIAKPSLPQVIGQVVKDITGKPGK